MACPWFFPCQPAGEAPGGAPALNPLGAPYRGECRAGAPAVIPNEETQRAFCNYGYAAARHNPPGCGRFPALDGPDAVRFSLCSDDGTLLEIRYAYERDHLPCGHGVLRFDVPRGKFLAPPEHALLEAQARAYTSSFLRHKPAATRPPCTCT